MNSKIKIYSIIIAVVYVCVISYTMYESCNDIVHSYKQSLKSGSNAEIKPIRFMVVDVVPTNGSFTFPNSEENLLTGEKIAIETNSLKIRLYDDSDNVPTYLHIIQMSLYILALILFIGLIYIPFAYFGIVKSIGKGEFMSRKTVKKTNRIGFILISCSILEILLQFVDTKIAQSQVQLPNYEIVGQIGFSQYAFFIMGMVILILAEILRESLRMKEEQELTI